MKICAINLSNTNYAVIVKYPGEYDEITEEEYDKSVKMAKDCLEWVEEKIKPKP